MEDEVSVGDRMLAAPANATEGSGEWGASRQKLRSLHQRPLQSPGASGEAAPGDPDGGGRGPSSSLHVSGTFRVPSGSPGDPALPSRRLQSCRVNETQARDLLGKPWARHQRQTVKFRAAV